MNDQLEELLEAVLKKRIRLEKNIVSSAQKAVEKNIRDLRSLIKSAEPVQETLIEIKKSVSDLSDLLNDDFKKERKRVFEFLSKRGWFLTGDMPSGVERKIYVAIQDGRKTEVEQAISGYFKGRLDDIRSEVLEEWKKRESILRDAFVAHDQEMYGASVPVLLAQSDGMFKKIGSSRLFHFLNEEKKIKKKKLIENFSKLREVQGLFIYRYFLEQIFVNRSIRATQNELEKLRSTNKGYGPINRHEILHGVDIGYPNEQNSLRVISLVKYLTDLKSILAERYSGDE